MENIQEWGLFAGCVVLGLLAILAGYRKMLNASLAKGIAFVSIFPILLLNAGLTDSAIVHTLYRVMAGLVAAIGFALMVKGIWGARSNGEFKSS